MADTTTKLPAKHKALVLTSRDKPLTVEEVPVPQPGLGSAVVHIAAAGVLSYASEVYTGKRPYPFPTPLVPGSSAVGRVAAVGPDSTLLKQGQLVYVSTAVRSRDDPSDIILMGLIEGRTDGSRKLMERIWRDGTYAEYARVPLEDCFPLDEERLLGPPDKGGFGYGIESLCSMSKLMVAFGGLNDISLKAGETIIIAPATGPFGSAAVHVALAMGARVVALGRNKQALDDLTKLGGGRVSTVPLTNEPETDVAALARYGPYDAYFDISPPEATGSTHLKSCILSLGLGGRVSLMGGLVGDVGIPHHFIMQNGITLKGKFVCTPEQAKLLIKMVEAGLIRLEGASGMGFVNKFPLEKWSEAFDCAAKTAVPGQSTVLVP